MPSARKISALFCDVGGVLLTNGWDHGSRRRLVEQFRLDGADFEDRHQFLSGALDTGQLTLDDYLDRAIFYRPRDFSKPSVRDFMYAQSQALPGSLELVARLAGAGRYLMATLNNESRELNLYRIAKFGLRDYFSVFFTSCYLGVQKPHLPIYRMALDVSQRPPDECVFVDDRPLNLECPRQLGLHVIQFASAAQLESELKARGLEF